MARKGRDAGPEIRAADGGLVALAIAACAGDSAVVDNLLIMPSHFDTLECSELVGQFQSASQRLYELTMPREKAGAVASALAYDTEYAKAKATKKYSEAAANRKGCDLSKKAPASATPRPEGSTGSHPHGEHPQPGRSGISASPRTASIFSVLRHLTDQDLKDMGVLLGHRRKILAAPNLVHRRPPTDLTLSVLDPQGRKSTTRVNEL